MLGEYLEMRLLGFGLFFIIVANAVKIGVTALQEFKDELAVEFDMRKKE
ncbi:hypothetical protein SAMN02745751_01266 [Dethiosulfatibacter aminovorans DSM 17477]|uniref:Uncharacterized protein n=1 Tax=Dethiosulfatibacter aminovorans DSM 17477 TaxID=1121476 RepID=A0A1M6ENS7_9FIRM|nr:hypothetical protein [Dethiosulfatibacter aminovorans]SHI87167.1 hypothetical protein SAMN02745751_01266 [Dethiosulfatibacter aminovorans DSM 17477]